jgi:hypothetical protein
MTFNPRAFLAFLGFVLVVGLAVAAQAGTLSWRFALPGAIAVLLIHLVMMPLSLFGVVDQPRLNVFRRGAKRSRTNAN